LIFKGKKPQCKKESIIRTRAFAQLAVSIIMGMIQKRKRKQITADTTKNSKDGNKRGGKQ